jgi:outer membrane protein assembly factor BamB
MKSIKVFTSLSLLLLVTLFLTACGAVPSNNYAGLSTDGKDLYMAEQNFIYSVNGDSGTTKWKFPVKPDQNMTFFGAPAVADGWLYAGSYKNVAYGFKLEGIDPGNPTPAWSFIEQEGKGRFMGAPAIAGDVVLYPSTDHHLYALDRKSGAQRWRSETRDQLWAPAAADDKYAYQAGMDHYLYVFDLANGSLRYEVDLGGPLVGGATLDQDGHVFVGNLNQEIIALEAASGNILWRKSVQGNVWSAPLVHEGKLYFGTDKNNVYIFSAANGQELKRVNAASSVIGSPVYTDGAIAIGTEGGEAFSMTLDGESRLWTNTTAGNLYSTPAVLNNQIVFAPYKGEHLLVGYDFAGNLDEKWNAVVPK